jgi:transcription elongation factor Elf1
MTKSKTSVGFFTRARSDIPYFVMASPYFTCDKCKKHIFFARSLRHAIFKKKGVSYVIPCKNCGYKNKRVKGTLVQEIDSRWEGL